MLTSPCHHPNVCYTYDGSVGFAPQTPEEEAAVHGAFAYFKDADHLVAINAVRATPSGGLHCGGPHFLCGAAAAVSDGTRIHYSNL